MYLIAYKGIREIVNNVLHLFMQLNTKQGGRVMKRISIAVVVFLLLLIPLTTGSSIKTREEVYIEWMRTQSVMSNAILSRSYQSTLGDLQDELLAIATIESKFNPTALGPQTRSGRARGAWQIMPFAWTKELKEKGIISESRDYWNIEDSAHAGEYVLKFYLEEKGSLDKALFAYVGGCRQYVVDVKEKLRSLRKHVKSYGY